MWGSKLLVNVGADSPWSNQVCRSVESGGFITNVKSARNLHHFPVFCKSKALGLGAQTSHGTP